MFLLLEAISIVLARRSDEQSRGFECLSVRSDVRLLCLKLLCAELSEEVRH